MRVSEVTLEESRAKPMKNKALLRLEKDVDRMVVQLRTSARLQKQLTRALDRNEAELEQLRGEVRRYRTERSDVRRTVDALIKRFERLDIDWDGIS